MLDCGAIWCSGLTLKDAVVEVAEPLLELDVGACRFSVTLLVQA